jgi:hypothetical protein
LAQGAHAQSNCCGLATAVFQKKQNARSRGETTVAAVAAEKI